MEDGNYSKILTAYEGVLDKVLSARTTELRNERNRFAALAFVWGDLLLELDGDLRIVFASGASDGILGYPQNDLAGKPFTGFLAKQFRPLVTEMLQVARRRGRMDNIQVRFNQREGYAECAGFHEWLFSS